MIMSAAAAMTKAIRWWYIRLRVDNVPTSSFEKLLKCELMRDWLTIWILLILKSFSGIMRTGWSYLLNCLIRAQWCVAFLAALWWWRSLASHCTPTHTLNGSAAFFFAPCLCPCLRMEGICLPFQESSRELAYGIEYCSEELWSSLG